MPPPIELNQAIVIFVLFVIIAICWIAQESIVHLVKTVWRATLRHIQRTAIFAPVVESPRTFAKLKSHDVLCNPEFCSEQCTCVLGSSGQRDTHPDSDTDSMDEQAYKANDPLCLPPVVVDNILEHLDDRSLLTARQVCTFWNTSITTRNKLWKHRCDRKPLFNFDLSEVVPFESRTFHEFIRYHRVYQQVRSKKIKKKIWQIDSHCNTQDCFPVTTKVSNTPTSGTTPSGGMTTSTDLSGARYKVTIAEGNLVVRSTRTGEELWRRQNILESTHSLSSICTVDTSGVFRKFRYSGSVQFEIQSHGQLRETVRMKAIHRSSQCHYQYHRGRFLLVEVASHAFYLVNVQLRSITKLPLPFDQMENNNGNDGKGKSKFQFMRFDSLDPSAVAMYFIRGPTIVVLVIEVATNNVLGEASKTFDNDSIWLLHNQHFCVKPENNTFSILRGDLISMYTITCKGLDQASNSRIRFELAWQKKMPQCFLPIHECDGSILGWGHEFLLGSRGRDIVLFRLHADKEEELITAPDFLPSCGSSGFRWDSLGDRGLGSLRLNMDKKRASAMRRPDKKLLVTLTNTVWLDGLSPASTAPERPILMLVKEPKLKCLRWSEGLWTDLHSSAP